MSSVTMTMPKRDDQTLSLRIPKEWYEDLRKRAFDAHRPMAEFIREALQQHFGYQEPPRDEGRKGGERYPLGGMAASALADHQR